MEKAKIFLIVQSVICVLVVFMLSFAAIGVYRDGKARKDEDPSAHIYTKEESVEAALPGLMVMFLGLGLTAACVILGIKDEKDGKPVALIRLSKEGPGKIVPEKKKDIPEDRLKVIRLILLALSIIFIIAGIANGNMNAVLIKAINICTECVGLG